METRRRSAAPQQASSAFAAASSTPHTLRSAVAKQRPQQHQQHHHPSNVLVALAAPLSSQRIFASPFKQRQLNARARLDAILSKVGALNAAEDAREDEQQQQQQWNGEEQAGELQQPENDKENGDVDQQQAESDREWAELNAPAEACSSTPNKRATRASISASVTPLKSSNKSNASNRRRSSTRGAVLKTTAQLPVIEVIGNDAAAFALETDEDFGGRVLDALQSDEEAEHYVRPLNPTSGAYGRDTLSLSPAPT